MNKSELIQAIAAETKLSKNDSKKALEAFLTTVSKSLKKGDKVALIGFGSWNVVKKTARMGRNPQTGQALKIPARKVVRFKVGSALAGKVK